MSEDHSEGFLPNAHAGPAWERARELLVQPYRDDASLAAVREEMAVRDLLHRYHYSWDQRDLDGILGHFTDDCVITDQGGVTTAGIAAIRARYERQMETTDHRFHLLSNIIVRLAADLRSGEVTWYHYAVLQKAGALPLGHGGLVADRVVKRDGEWKISARSTGVDLIHPIAATPAGD